jgi:hypothetical protein
MYPMKREAVLNTNGNWDVMCDGVKCFCIVFVKAQNGWRVNALVPGRKGSRTISATPNAAADKYFGKNAVTFTAKGYDVTVDNHGSIVLFHLHTDAARAWVSEHVSDEAQFFGGALVVEPRYVENLIEGMTSDGLEVR